MQRHPKGYDPLPDRSSNSFPAMGGDVVNDIVADLNFPRDPRQQLMARGGTADLCRTCGLLPEDHQTEAAQAGYSPLGEKTRPGVHWSVDSGETRNYADLLSESRTQAFRNSTVR